MLGFPWLSRGKVGRLTFEHFNRIMRAVERIEQTPESPGYRPVGYLPVFARLTGTPQAPPQGWPGWSMWQWIEVEAALSGGVWSWTNRTIPQVSSNWNPEAFAVVPESAAAGAIVRLDRMPSKHGDVGEEGVRALFVGHPVDSGAAKVDWGKTVQRVPAIGALGFPGYDVALYGGSVTYGSPSGLTVKAAALFELAGTTQDQVQNESPGTKTILDIPNGTNIGPLFKTGVPVSETPGDTLWVFTWPNAYGVVC